MFERLVGRQRIVDQICSIVALKLARRSKEPKLEDLHYINKVVRKIKMKAIGGNIVLLRNKRNKKVLPLFWKSTSIQNVCHSSKEAETRNMVKLLDETLYQANIIEQVLHNKREKMEVKLFTDNKPYWIQLQVQNRWKIKL